MDTIVRNIDSEFGREVFITIRPDPAESIIGQARVFSEVRRILDKYQAWICQERIYAPAQSVPLLADWRSKYYGEYDDGVAPSWLVGGPEETIRGVQVYAVSSRTRPQPLLANGHRCGRQIFHNGCRWITASALPTRADSTPEAQTRQAFEQAESLLKPAGGDLSSISRTWFHLDKILDWYPRFNETRTRLFMERGLLQPHSAEHLPASTGIGVRPATGQSVLMDMFAVIGHPACPWAPGGCLCTHQATGHQQSAYAYGSSFSRAATDCTPAGRTVFVSGTAAIDTDGKTCHVGDIPGQINMTIECLNAVLRDRQCSSDDVVQAIAYCKSPDVEACFKDWSANSAWP